MKIFERIQLNGSGVYIVRLGVVHLSAELSTKGLWLWICIMPDYRRMPEGSQNVPRGLIAFERVPEWGWVKYANGGGNFYFTQLFAKTPVTPPASQKPVRSTPDP